MGQDSPLVGIALAVGIPLLIRSSSSSSFSAKLLRPRPHLRTSARTSPSEFVIVALIAASVLYNLSKLWPWSPAFRLAQDVFRHTDLPIGINSATLRSRLATKTVRELGLHQLQTSPWPSDSAGGAEGDLIDRLLRRLASMNARQMYLLLGAEAVLDCHYCKQPLDLQYYAFPALFLAYAPQFLLLNILTVSSSVLSSIDDLIAPIWPVKQRSATANESLDKGHASAANWRATASILLLLALLAESLVVSDWMGWSENQFSWVNHWHHNAYIVRHTLFVLLPILLYIYPTAPPAAASNPMARLQRSLVHVGANIGKSTSNVSVLDAGRRAVWADAGMRDAVAAWYKANAEQAEADNHFLDIARERGMLQQDATAKVRQTVQSQIESLRDIDRPS